MAQILNNLLEEPEKAYNTLTGWVAYGLGKHLIAPGTKTRTVLGKATNWRGLAYTLFPQPDIDTLRYFQRHPGLRQSTTGRAARQIAAGSGRVPRAALLKSAKTAFKTFNVAFSLSFAYSIGKGLTNWAMTAGRDTFTNRFSVPVANQMSGAAYTQRQRAISAIHNSQLTTRAVFGNEAAYLH